MAKKCQITKEPANQAVYDYASDVLLVTYQLFNCRSSSVNLAIFLHHSAKEKFQD